MSHVDNWVLMLSVMEGPEEINQLNSFLEEADPHRKQRFRPLNEDNWGGSKNPEVNVYAMACNNFPVGDVLDAIHRTDWDDPENGRVICNTQGDDWIIKSLDDVLEGKEYAQF